MFKELCDECMSFGIFEGEERILWCGKHETRLPPYKAERPCERNERNSIDRQGQSNELQRRGKAQN